MVGSQYSIGFLQRPEDDMEGHPRPCKGIALANVVGAIEEVGGVD